MGFGVQGTYIVHQPQVGYDVGIQDVRRARGIIVLVPGESRVSGYITMLTQEETPL